MTDRFPWFPFYAADWLTSPAVLAMSLEQQGAYLRLLAIAWNAGRDEPALPAAPAELARMLGLSLKRWTTISRPILGCFERRGDLLYNAKLTQVWEIQRAKYNIAAMAGRASGEARRKQRSSNGRSTGVAIPLQPKGNHTDADTNRTKSSSGPTAIRALTDGALASARKGRT
ncbi:MAG: DUF1376 domain-containing protein [Methylocystis sp.]|uniref:DUF1376 domain-containing protein n=1 Tax=Methylocystis sp. TaxID=1911079 RepID=UPI003DA5A5DD